MDAGYASEENLKKLKDKDVYMPDRGFVTDRKNELRKYNKKGNKNLEYPDLEFKYDETLNEFTCPSGKKNHKGKQRTHQIQGVNYLRYYFYKCKSCNLKPICAGENKHNKQISVRADSMEGLNIKYIRDKRSKGRAINRSISLPLTVKMREKLKSQLGKKIFKMRFPIAEGVIGLMKGVRQGNKFNRRRLKNVQMEWTERCIAHNLGKMIGFART